MMEAEWRPSTTTGCRVLIVAHASCPKCPEFVGPPRMEWSEARADAVEHDLEFHPEWDEKLLAEHEPGCMCPECGKQF